MAVRFLVLSSMVREINWAPSGLLEKGNAGDAAAGKVGDSGQGGGCASCFLCLICIIPEN